MGLLRRAWLAGALASAAVGVGGCWPSEPTPKPAGGAKLEVLRVDDLADPFAKGIQNRDPLPEGISFFTEVAPKGPGLTAPTTVARLALRPGEDRSAGVARFRRWLGTIAVPPGTRFGVMIVREVRDSFMAEVDVRSVLLTGEPVLRNEHVADALAVPPKSLEPSAEAFVAVRLSREGTRLFEDATRGWVERRIAIVVDDEVVGAPRVHGPISDGYVTISMGTKDAVNVQIVEADRLARALSGR